MKSRRLRKSKNGRIIMLLCATCVALMMSCMEPEEGDGTSGLRPYDPGRDGPLPGTTTPSVTVPATPTGVSATATSSNSITVSWSAVSGATGYYVYRSTSASGTYTQVGSSTTTSYSNTGLSANTTYYYKVAAYNSAGTGTQSSTVSATTQSSNAGVVDPSTVVMSTMTDPRDNKTYKTVKIGTQTWMAENLNYVNSSWSKNDVTGSVSTTDKGSWCYNNNSLNCNTYGRLYTWAAAVEACPALSGWYLPTDAEWNVLMTTVGGSSYAGTKLKSSAYWNSYSGVPTGTNVYGFSALPGGDRYYDGSFSSVGYFGYWWSATELSASGAWIRTMYCYYENVYRDWLIKNDGISVRCVRRD